MQTWIVVLRKRIAAGLTAHSYYAGCAEPVFDVGTGAWAVWAVEDRKTAILGQPGV
jgi:hypothetical protein